MTDTSRSVRVALHYIRFGRRGLLVIISLILIFMTFFIQEERRISLYEQMKWENLRQRQFLQNFRGSSAQQRFDVEDIETIEEDISPGGVIGPAHLHPSRFVKGVPTASYKGNLKPEYKYLTTWSYGGMTNNFILTSNLIFLSFLSRRIAVIPPMISEPNHVVAPPLDFGKAFDLPRLAQELQWPVIEWKDVKNVTLNGQKEEMGCWSFYSAFGHEDRPMAAYTPDRLRLAITYTPVPAWTKLLPPHDRNSDVSYHGLAQLMTPIGREEALAASSSAIEKRQSFEKSANLTIDPDDHFTCFDNLYYLGVQKTFEFELDKYWSPSWNLVGRHIHFTKELEAVGERILRGLFKVAKEDPLPPFIAIHARRTDFLGYCNKKFPIKECLVQVPGYAKAVDEVKAELAKKYGKDHSYAKVTNIIMTSDEEEPDFWNAVQEKGWKWVDFKAEKDDEFGDWYPTLLDAVIQSKAIGFVGTDGSTMSMAAARRNHDWNRGVYKLLKNNYRFNE